MNKARKELLLKYNKLINLDLINQEELLKCTGEEQEIYMGIDTDGILAVLNAGSDNIAKIKERLSLDNLRKIKTLSSDDGTTYVNDINMIVSLLSLKDCKDYKLLISDVLEVSESAMSLTSDFHNDNMKALYEVITSNEKGELKEAKTFAILMSATKGKVCKTDSGIDYPTTYLEDLEAIKRTDNEDSAYAIGNIMTVPTKGQWDTRNKYINVISKCSDYDTIEILTEMATNYYAIMSDYYEYNLETVLTIGDIEVIHGIIATNEESLESKYHTFNMGNINELKSLEIPDEEIIEVLTNKESLESGSHMCNVEEFAEKRNKNVKTLRKVLK